MTDDDPSPAAVIIKAHPDPDEPEMIDFFYWLGNCVNHWAYVDRQLFYICRFTLRTDDRRAALIYYRDRSFEGRLRFVEEALRGLVDPSIFAHFWKPLRKDARALAATRNILAHHPAMRYAAAKDGKPYYEWSIHIEPYERLLGREYPGLMGKDAIRVDDLKAHVDAVEKLYSRLSDFLYKVLTAKHGL
jgi:hypothetical protein